MKLFAIIAFLFLTNKQSFCQDNCLKWEESRTLQISDFLGNVSDTSHSDAMSFAEVKYSYQFNSPRDFKFDVYANFNRNSSWIKKGIEDEALLRHEQLHFDIAELFARRIKYIFDHFMYTENYASEILALFNEQKTRYHVMQDKYDQETDHSVNSDKQREWSIYIARELAKSEPKTVHTEFYPLMASSK
jgi:hypothetical protein